MPSYLITGASRGIGLSLVQHLLALPETFVIATARRPEHSTGLQELAAKYSKDRLAILSLDVSSPKSLESAANEAVALLPNGLDHLVLNAGIHPQPLCTFDDIDFKLLQEELRFNTEFPIVTIQAFLPLLRKGTIKKVVFLSSILGSIENGGNMPGLTNAYSISKAALNMVARKYGALLKYEGITTAAIHPGWVLTDIGEGIEGWMKTYAPSMKAISLEESATGVIRAVENAKLDDGVTFVSWEGKKLAW